MNLLEVFLDTLVKRLYGHSFQYDFRHRIFYFSKNENLKLFINIPQIKTENVKQINCLLDKIITRSLSFKKYTNNDANRNSIKIIDRTLFWIQFFIHIK